MGKELLIPDYIFESSWEVCNKVGGIYTVLSTRAKTLQEQFNDKIIFIGPDCWKEKESPYFQEEPSLFAEWQWEAKEQGLKVRVGRWTIPGEPIAVLVDFAPFFERRTRYMHGFGSSIRLTLSMLMVIMMKPLCSHTQQDWWWKASTSIFLLISRKWSTMPMNGCVD